MSNEQEEASLRVSKALLELMANAAMAGAGKGAVFSTPEGMAKLDASVREYAAALDAWAGFSISKEPIIAQPQPQADFPVAAPPTYNPFVERAPKGFEGVNLE